MRLFGGLLLSVTLVAVACSSSSGGASGLQSECVRDQLNLGRTLPDGAKCYNLGYSDCGGAAFASECVGACAFDVCQSKPCSSNAECPGFCKDYVVSGVSYGRWCDGKTCEHGTLDCPCAEGSCIAPDTYYQIACNAEGVCEGNDTCPSGCRVRSASGVSVCCGGALCSGGCVGTPCCH